jgi:predicted nucleic acid-binding protein
MTLANIPSGTSVFLDANIFVYHFSPHPVFRADCDQLLDRVEQQDLQGFTSTHVVGECAHRLMMFEAAAVHGWSSSKTKQRLRNQAAAPQRLTQFRAAVDAILNSKIEILTIEPSLLLIAADVSRQSGLLSNDALLVAVMRANGLTHLASHDADFDRVPGLARYGPG